MVRTQELKSETAQTVIHIRDGVWSNLALIVFCVGLAVCAAWLDYRSHGDVGVVAWIFGSVLVLFCAVPVCSIRNPRSCWLGVEGADLVWRISSGKTGQTLCEKRLPKSSVRGLAWVTPAPSTDAEPAAPRLFIVTQNRGSHELPSEFFAACYRRKIETALREHIPGLAITESTGRKKGRRVPAR